jgi:hypothetical protein
VIILFSVLNILIGIIAWFFLDGYPGTSGYRYFFLFIALLCIFGLVSACLILRKYAGKQRKLEIKVSLRNNNDA